MSLCPAKVSDQAHHHGSRVKLEPGVQEVHGSELAESPEAEVEEVDDVDGQHRDEVELKVTRDL